MDELILLNAMLRYHASNFQNLHWNTYGIEFDDAHKDISAGYYELCDKYVDSTAEMLARLDAFALNFNEVADLASARNWTGVESDKLYDRTEISLIAQDIFDEILEAISDCFDADEMSETENAGIRSELEAIQEAFDLQGRYINKRRVATL